MSTQGNQDKQFGGQKNPTTGGYQTGQQGDIVAIVATGSSQQFQAKSGSKQGRTLHLRNPQTNEEMTIQLVDRQTATQQQTNQGSSQGQQSQTQTWEVIQSDI